MCMLAVLLFVVCGAGGQEVWLRLALRDLATGGPLAGVPVQVVIVGRDVGELVTGEPDPSGVLEARLHLAEFHALTVSAPGYAPAEVSDLQVLPVEELPRARLVVGPRNPVSLAPRQGGWVPWRPEVPFTWDVFRAVPPATADQEAARIAVVLSFRYVPAVQFEQETGQWRAAVVPGLLETECAVDPARSWVRPGRDTPAVLAHEQGHFDLGEVYRRLLVDVILDAEAYGATPEQAARELVGLVEPRARALLARLEATQARYDRQTAHGLDSQAQAAWSQAIARWLIDPAQAP
ncbi:MAG: DUF922 domain-containing protein [Candidatus Bipolaricaulaceae bacterium]